MANVKWIKITVDMFDDEKIKIIQSMPDGDTLLIVWIKLITLAGKTNDGGYVYISENMPYTDEMLSVIMNKPLTTIRLALETFSRLGMIENDVKGIYLLNFEKHQSLDKLEKLKEQNRLRVAKCREKKRLESGIKYCAYCGEEATGIDHIIPIARGGSEKDNNKVSCCIRCNRIKNDKPLVDFLNTNREIINDELIRNNNKLNKYVMLCNVTDHYIVMESNDIDIDKEEDKEEEKEIDINISPVKAEQCIPYKEITEYLNNRTGSNYKHTTNKTKDLIKARFNEGFNLDDFKIVIDKKSVEWMNTDMQKYLRPETLFGTKFESYLNQSVQQKKQEKTFGNPFMEILKKEYENNE